MDARDVIAGSVGHGGANHVVDVRVVQRLLNDWLARNGQTELKVDGLVGPKTSAAITGFQKSNMLSRDGRVDVGGPTLNALFAMHVSGLVGAIDASRIAIYIGPLALDDRVLSDPTVTELLRKYVVILRKSA